MKLRKLVDDDFVQWLTLWVAYQAFYQTQLPDDVNQTTFNRLLDPKEEMGCFVVEDEQQRIIGFTHFLYHRSTWSIANNCYLQDLYVFPEYRNLGIARQLIEAVYAEAEKNECAKVYWLTQETNQTARHLYDKIAENSGFIQYRKNL